MIEKWEMKAGNITLCPLTGYATAVVPMLVALRIGFQTGPEAPETGDRFLQLGIFAAQARELGQALIAAADKADQRPPGMRQ